MDNGFFIIWTSCSFAAGLFFSELMRRQQTIAAFIIIMLFIWGTVVSIYYEQYKEKPRGKKK